MKARKNGWEVEGTVEEIQQITGIKSAGISIASSEDVLVALTAKSKEVKVKSKRGRFNTDRKWKWPTAAEIADVNSRFDPSGTVEAHKNNMLLAREWHRPLPSTERMYHHGPEHAVKIQKARDKISRNNQQPQTMDQN